MTFKPGDVVRVTSETEGCPAGSEGIVLELHLEEAEILISLLDAGPLRVPVDAVELVERGQSWSDDPRD